MTARLGDFMTQQWRRSLFSIRMSNIMADGGMVMVDGIVLEMQPSIGLHIGTTHFVDVTHVPSGARIASFDTLGGAMDFANRVAFLRDWTDPSPKLTEQETKAIHDIQSFISTSERKPFRSPA